MDYQKIMKDREEKIKDYKGGLLCFTEVKNYPQSIFFIDLQKSQEHWINKNFSEYYHLEQVAICED